MESNGKDPFWVPYDVLTLSAPNVKNAEVDLKHSIAVSDTRHRKFNWVKFYYFSFEAFKVAH